MSVSVCAGAQKLKDKPDCHPQECCFFLRLDLSHWPEVHRLGYTGLSESSPSQYWACKYISPWLACYEGSRGRFLCLHSRYFTK